MICTGRAPFDLAEAESELIAGNMLELSGISFSFTLVAEYYEAFLLTYLICTLLYWKLHNYIYNNINYNYVHR
jgi:NADH-quinone oxidoreductase subunit H